MRISHQKKKECEHLFGVGMVVLSVEMGSTSEEPAV